MRKAASIIGLIVGVCLIFSAVAVPLVIDMGNPATYRSSWGGPSLAGVLLVNCGPGVLAAIVVTRAVIRRRGANPRRRARQDPSDDLG